MGKLFTKQKMMFTAFFLTLVIAAELFIHFSAVPGWAMFAPLIFYFLGHKNNKNILPIFVGGIMGLLSSLILHFEVALLYPSMGDFIPKLLFICLFIFSIIIFKDVLPVAFNDYTFFSYLLMEIAKAYQAPVIVVTTQVVGGLLLIGGVLLIERIMKKPLENET